MRPETKRIFWGGFFLWDWGVGVGGNYKHNNKCVQSWTD